MEDKIEYVLDDLISKYFTKDGRIGYKKEDIDKAKNDLILIFNSEIGNLPTDNFCEEIAEEMEKNIKNYCLKATKIASNRIKKLTQKTKV